MAWIDRWTLSIFYKIEKIARMINSNAREYKAGCVFFFKTTDIKLSKATHARHKDDTLRRFLFFVILSLQQLIQHIFIYSI